MKPSYLTTHMISAVREQLKHYHDREIAKRLNDTLRMYAHATKFLLPFDGVLFEDTNIARYVEFLRLPFPSIVLEYEGTSGAFHHPAENLTQISVLAREMIRDELPGIAVFVAYKHTTTRWTLLPAVLFIPKGTTADDLVKRGIPAYQIDEEFMNEIAEGVHAPPKEIAQEVALAIFKESLSVFQFCAACECRNVKYDEVKAPKFINQKRAAKGEVPLFEYKVLTVDITKHPEHKEPKGGTHASPREHVRRGHIRRYQDGHTVWINSMIVGRAELGRVVKDYRVKPPAVSMPPFPKGLKQWPL